VESFESVFRARYAGAGGTSGTGRMSACSECSGSWSYGACLLGGHEKGREAAASNCYLPRFVRDGKQVFETAYKKFLNALKYVFEPRGKSEEDEENECANDADHLVRCTRAEDCYFARDCGTCPTHRNHSV